MMKIFKVIKYLIVTALCVGILYAGYYCYFNSDEAIKKFHSFLEENFEWNYGKDRNEKNNYNELIDSGKVKNRAYIDEEFYPYFGLLNEAQKEVYYDIIEGANEYKQSITPSMKIQVADVKDIFYAVMYDHPEIFWLDSHYSYDFYQDTNEVIKINLTYTSVIDNIIENRRQFDEIIDTIVTNAKTYQLDYEREKYVHDTLVNKITYDDEYKDDQSAFNAIVNSRSVCAGYAKAFQIIMTKLGIPTYYITGEAKGDHAWNLILLEDGYYNVDVTWDDQVDRIIYKYYNVNEEKISVDHTRKELSSMLVKAEGIKYANTYSTLGA